MPLNTPDFPSLSDSDFPPHSPPEKTINEEQRYLKGSAVKRSDQVIIVTPVIARAHAWMATQGYTKRHAIVLVTEYPMDYPALQGGHFTGGQVKLMAGCEQGLHYAEIMAGLLTVVDDGTGPADWQWV